MPYRNIVQYVNLVCVSNFQMLCTTAIVYVLYVYIYSILDGYGRTVCRQPVATMPTTELRCMFNIRQFKLFYTYTVTLYLFWYISTLPCTLFFGIYFQFYVFTTLNTIVQTKTGAYLQFRSYSNLKFSVLFEQFVLGKRGTMGNAPLLNLVGITSSKLLLLL